MKKNDTSGFTLMELMIVLAIIGILVAIAIPSYKIYTRRARYTEIIQAAAPYKIGVEQCFLFIGSLDGCVAGKNGVPPAVSQNGLGLVESVNVEQSGVITITPKNKYGITSKDTYVLTPEDSHGILIWKSSGGGVTEGYAN